MAISFKRRPLSALPFGSSGGVSVVAEVCEPEDNRISQLAFLRYLLSERYGNFKQKLVYNEFISCYQ